jgi:hypothetical protein
VSLCDRRTHVALSPIQEVFILLGNQRSLRPCLLFPLIYWNLNTLPTQHVARPDVPCATVPSCLFKPDFPVMSWGFSLCKNAMCHMCKYKIG